MKTKTHILCSVTPPPRQISYLSWCNVEKYCGTGQDTADSMAHVHFMLDT
jgi:hypothetical protein